jgi:hypothetical protein
VNAREVRRRWIREGRDRIDRDAWTKIFASTDPQQFMTARERKKFAALPDTFTVYRGYVNFPDGVFDNADGLSWTLDRNVAEFFTSEMIPGVVSNIRERRVQKSNVFAYVEKNGNNEKEIIILPAHPEKRRAGTTGEPPKKRQPHCWKGGTRARGSAF